MDACVTKSTIRLREIETHCHTKEVSPCSRIGGAELIRLYHQYGYYAVIITDHFKDEVFDHPRMRGKSWEEKVELYLSGYRNAKAQGDKLGIKVFLGLEATPPNSPYDFLIYGVDEDFLKEQGPFYQLEMPEIYQLMHDHGKIVFHAHPYRYSLEPENPEYYDGIEIFNAHPRVQNRNQMALQFAQEHTLWTISGSDAHDTGDVGRSGVMMPESVDCMEAFVQYYKEKGSPELIILFDK
jgi:hypothetical protein